MILTCAFFSEIAGGLFHFKKDHAQYSLKPEDYATKPLFVALALPTRPPPPPPAPPPAARGFDAGERHCACAVRR